jgi:mannosyltransferase OCH1-like enzyme
MKIKIKLIHKEWEDIVILDLLSNRLTREKNTNEHATFNNNKKLLFIKWDNWDEEIFITHENNNIYYLCSSINFIHKNWDNICYIDYINKIIYNESFNYKGTFEEDDEYINVTWNNYNDEIKYNNFNIIDNFIDNNITDKNVSDKNVSVNIIDKNIEDNINIIFNEPINNKKIPNIIHFIYGFKNQVDEFDLYKYIAIKSAYDINKPEKVYLYYYNEPHGYWWDKIKPILTLEKITPPAEIFGNKIYHYAHQADIIRLQKLILHGGIYLDIDTICIKSFNDLLMNDFVMGVQTNSTENTVYGLCNAVILSVPNSIFALKWLESYRTFRSNGRDEFWDEHSVIKPLELSKIYTEDIKILNYKAFFYPLWYNINDILFNEKYGIDQYKDIVLNNYCIHLWDTYSNDHLKKLNENIIFSHNTLYNIFSRKFLRNTISIVMLTYNRYDITVKCLESYLKCLDNNNIEELIILDNNSDLDLIDYLKKYQEKNEKIKLILSNENLGVCGGRIILFNEAIGDIIISIDSDAYLINNIFFDKIMHHLYDEKYGIVGISGAYIKNWNFGSQEDIPDDNYNEYYVDHIAGCCQAFRRELFHFGFGLDSFYGKFWVEDTDLSMQSLSLNKINYRISQKNYLKHEWGGGGKKFQDLFLKNWNYFVKKWRGKVLLHLK